MQAAFAEVPVPGEDTAMPQLPQVQSHCGPHDRHRYKGATVYLPAQNQMRNLQLQVRYTQISTVLYFSSIRL